MATTGELRVIIEELQLVDIGDAASYLGEEEIAGLDSATLSDSLAMVVPLNLQEIKSSCLSCS